MHIIKNRLYFKNNDYIKLNKMIPYRLHKPYAYTGDKAENGGTYESCR